MENLIAISLLSFHILPIILSILCITNELKLGSFPIIGIIFFLLSITFLIFLFNLFPLTGILLAITEPIAGIFTLIIYSYLRAVKNSIELKNKKTDLNYTSKNNISKSLYNRKNIGNK